MGCSTSKIENEEVVSRCSARKRSIRDAVGARHNFAAAFSSYVIALRTTGSALSQYGEAESREQPPPPPDSAPSAAAAAASGSSSATPPFNVRPPPMPTFFPAAAPPPAPSSSAVAGAAENGGAPAPPMAPVLDPLKRSVSLPPIPMGETKKKAAPPKVRKKKPPSPTTPPAGATAAAEAASIPIPSPSPAPEPTPAAAPDTPPASPKAQPPPPPVPSVVPPPMPPPSSTSFLSDLFTGLSAQQAAMSQAEDEDEAEEAERRRKKKLEEEAAVRRREEMAAAAEQRRQQQLRLMEEEERRKKQEQEQMMKAVEEAIEEEDEEEEEDESGSETEEGESEEEEEEVTIEDEDEDENPKKAATSGSGPAGTTPSSSNSATTPAASTSASVNLDLPKTDLAIVTTRTGPGLNLLQLMKKMDELFYEAYESGRDVANRLEAQRVSFHPNFIDNKSNDASNHTSKVLRAISWSQQGTVPEASKSSASDATQETETPGTHASTLDRLLAWEKKLLEEIKRAEAIRIEHEKKNQLLQREEAKASSPERIEKSKAALQSLQTRFVVALQGVDTARSMVLRLRDKELYPQLLELLEGLRKMWKKIHECHVEQQKLVNNMKLELSDLVEFTHDFQKVATEQLKTALNRWYQHFGSVVGTEREYMRQLNSYVQVSIVPLENYSDKDKLSSSPDRPPIASLCHVWQQAMDRLPDRSALEPIHYFVRAMQQIVEMQAEEAKLKKRVDHYENELKKKEKYVAEYERKHLSSFSSNSHLSSSGSGIPGPGTPSTPSDLDDTMNSSGNTKNDLLEMARHPLTEKRAQLEVLRRRTLDETEKAEMLGRDMRTKTMVTLETNLPSVFRAVTHFSKLCSDAHQGIHELSQTSLLAN